MRTELRHARPRAILPAVLLVTALAASGCRPARTATAPLPATSETRQPLPAVGAVDGPLAPRVQYPSANAQIARVDSNFINGSVGSGRATLTINGHPVQVHPNGAFIAWLPLPGLDSGTAAAYEIVATKDGETARLVHPIRVAPKPAPAIAPAMPAETPKDSVVPGRKPDTTTTPLDTITRWVRLGVPNAASDTDKVIIGRPIPGGTYKWFFTPGTRVQRTGISGAFTKVRLDSQLEVWVGNADVTRAEGDTAPPRRIAGNLRIEPAADWVDVIVPVGAMPAYLVEEKGSTLELTLYATTATTDVMRWVGNDSTIRNITWEQLASDRVRYTLQLDRAPYGFLVLYENNRLVLRVRRTPAIDAAHPLRGTTIVVDPGHPPIGATGPTGFYEAEATLRVGEHLQRILQERGARVVMTRTTMDPVELGLRPIIARRANAHAFVSIHYNALPDGVNPFVNARGAGTYFFRSHSEPLARAVQRRLALRMGVDDYGVYYDNLAVVRPPWVPAILTEGAYIMMPEQEAAARTPEYQERYALAIAEGIEAWLRGLASDR